MVKRRKGFFEKLGQFALDSRTYIPLWNLNIVWRASHRQATSILDVGCGPGASMRALLQRKRFFTVGADIYRPYLEECKAQGTHDECVLCDVRWLPFRRESFDIVMCLEVVEHLSEGDGLRLISAMEEIARRQVIINTPVGLCRQQAQGENPYEEHRSSWTPGRFRSMGYRARGYGLPHMGGDEFLSASRLPRFLVPLRHLIWILATPLVYFLPRLAGEMVCIRHLEPRGS